ncbi:MAG: hypothetical protein WBQ55_28350, partial [Xanthobacteraceae bacterium]
PRNHRQRQGTPPRAPDEAFLDRETRIEERIDAKIDSDIKGLGQTKAMKAIGIGKPRVATPTKPLEQIDSRPEKLNEALFVRKLILARVAGFTVCTACRRLLRKQVTEPVATQALPRAQ